jgi:hypothetical protein
MPRRGPEAGNPRKFLIYQYHQVRVRDLKGKNWENPSVLKSSYQNNNEKKAYGSQRRILLMNQRYSFDWAYFFQTFSRYTGPLL